MKFSVFRFVNRVAAALLLLCCVLSVFGRPTDEMYEKMKKKYPYVTQKSDCFVVSGFQNNVMLYGVVDENGNEVTNKYYEGISYFTELKNGMIAVKENGKWGIIDLNGNYIVQPKYDVYELNVATYPQGLLKVKVDGKWGVLDVKTDRMIIPTNYSFIYFYKDKGMFEVQNGTNCGMADRNGKMIIPVEYLDVACSNDFCFRKRGDKWGVTDRNGNNITDCKYDNFNGSVTHRITDNLFMVLNNGKYGLIDAKGREILPCVYKTISNKKYTKDFSLELVVLDKDGMYGLMSPKGKVIAEPIYNAFITSGDNATCILTKGAQFNSGAMGYIYPNNLQSCVLMNLEDPENPIVSDEYTYISRPVEDLCLVNRGGRVTRVDPYSIPEIEGGLWGYMDITGKLVIEPQYQFATTFNNGVANVVKDGVASVLPHPINGTQLTIVKGAGGSHVDSNIPQRNTKAADTFAFVIGVEGYNNLQGADYSLHDAQIFAEYLKKTFGVAEKNVYLYEDATFGNMISALKRMEDIADAYDGDATFYFYFSGLGISDNQKQYLLLSDSSLGNLGATAMSLGDMLSRFDKLNLKGFNIIIDAPFNGNDKQGKKLEANRGVALKAKPLSSRYTVMMSDGANGNSFSNAEMCHGLMTYHLLNTIQKSSAGESLSELFDKAAIDAKKASVDKFTDIQAPQKLK